MTYKELGERLGVDVCTDCSLTRHNLGFWGADGRFHWRERALRRTSIRTFVWRIATKQTVEQPGEHLPPGWLRYWRRVRWAKDALRQLHVRLPASAWDHQRATLRALLVHAGAGFFLPSPHQEATEVTRKAATRWAKRPIEPADPAG